MKKKIGDLTLLSTLVSKDQTLLLFTLEMISLGNPSPNDFGFPLTQL